MNINESMNQRQWISIVGFEQVNFSFGVIVRIPPPPFIQQGVKFTEAWHILWFFTYLYFLISPTDKHSNTQHTQGGSRLTHPYKYKYLNHLLCARSSYLYYIKWLSE